jgi:hypothetical protein
LFKRFDKEYTDDGDVILTSPFFVLSYSFADGILACDDGDVLYDFTKLISNSYGTRTTREIVKDSIEWSSLKDGWAILNIGVCILPDSDVGWDGSPNSIYYDDKAPGKVVRIYHQFWNTIAINGAWKLSIRDLNGLGGSVVLPNLLDALVLHRKDKIKHKKVQDLISNFQTCL